jgi:membrane-bound ClpP family serine protease
MAKVTNDAAAYIKSIAEQRGQHRWAEKAVREHLGLGTSPAAQAHRLALDLNDQQSNSTAGK